MLLAKVGDIMFDEDVKIADEKSLKRAASVKRQQNGASEEYEKESASGNILKARSVGEKLAADIVKNLDRFALTSDGADDGMSLQRGILMTFAALVSIESRLESSVVAQTAKSSFNQKLEGLDPGLYRAVSNSGAVSFYYLAYRRGTEVDRRVGQTFAMLCSHDGDPIYQELGEAIYCWATSFIGKEIDASGL